MGIPYQEEPLSPVQTIPFSINVWQGLNRIKGSGSRGEMVSMKNMSSDKTPFASPRPSREIIADGITNPQNLFSANDKLGYISSGNLYYDKGNGLESIGTVGNTSAIADFNGNIVMYPSDKNYDYVDDGFETINEFLEFEEGSWDAQTGAASTSADDVDAGYHEVHGRVATFRLNSEILTPNNETITINSNVVEKPPSKDFPWYDYYVRLYVVAFNSGGSVITYDESGTYYKKADFGSPLQIEGAARLKIMVGYSRTSRAGGSTSADVDGRDADFANSKTKLWKNTSQYPVTGSIPTIKYACVDNNRIIGVEGNNFYASSQGSFSDWTTFADEEGNPDPAGSFAYDFGTPQDISGVVKYNGKVIVFKPDVIYEVYNNKPPYTIIEGAETGCIDGRSICEVNSVLYWLGRQGIYAYTGGQPRIISRNVNKTFTQGVAGTDGRKYYISAYDGSVWELYVYDTYTGLWHMEDNFQAVGFAYCQGYLHALSADGMIYKFNSSDERVSWEFETQDFTFDTPNTKSVRRLFIRAELEPYSELDIYLKSNNGDYERVAQDTYRGTNVVDFKVRVKKCDSFALKFAGRGNVKILDVHGEVTIGTSKHRSGENLKVYR